MVCTCFVIGFYPLAERCYCILSECSLHRFTDPHCCFSFAWVIDWGGVVTRLPRKYSFSSCLPLHVYLEFDLFTFRHAFPQQTARWTLDAILLTPHPCLPSPLSSKPVIICWMLSVTLRLAAGQLKDKQLLNKSMTLFRTNRAVERV